MSSEWPYDQVQNMKDGDEYRRLQAKELMLRFEEAHGRRPQNVKELKAWVAAGGGGEDKPIKPRPGLTLTEQD